MSRRLPALLTLAVTVGLFALTSGLTAQPPKTGTDPAAGDNPGDGLKRGQEENLKLYKRFADELLRLAQKWEKSDNPEDKARANTIRSALKVADEKRVESLFKEIVGALADARNPTGTEFGNLMAKDAKLTGALKEILATLRTEDEMTKLKREIEELKAYIKEVERIKREQENLLARTEQPKSDPNRIAKDQDNLAKDTKDLANKMSKGDPKGDPKAGDPKGGNPNAKDDKSEPKPEAKPGDNTAEPKTDTKENKTDPKDPSAAGSPTDPKQNPNAGAEPKPGGMNPDAGSDKPMPPEANDPMAGKGMGGEPKPMTDPMNPMAGGGEPKPSQGDSKSQGDGKGDSKPSAGMPGGDGKPMGGQPSNSPPSAPKPGGSPSPGGSPGGSPPPPNPNNPNDQARQNVEDAVPQQKGAEGDLKKNDRPNASKKEDEAIKSLDKALKELEKRLKQLREKEMLKKLEDLEIRVKKMIAMQTEVYEATKGIDANVRKNMNQRSGVDIQKSQAQSETELAIVVEAEKALRLLEGEGSAVVFAGVLAEVKKDMEAVAEQLKATNVGAETQLVEEQIIAQLQRMLEALKKAKQDLENQPPPPGPPGQPPPPGSQDLIKLVEQLKLLRELQVQVNERTTFFGKKSPGEQAADPFIQDQLKKLGDRQKILQDMLHKIASGDGKN